MTHFEADLLVRKGSFELAFTGALATGEVLAVLGPNGAGKSTLLGALTGQTPSRRAHITLDGRVLAGPGVNVPTHKRGIALLAQNPLLFPHMSAVANVAFGPRSTGTGKGAAQELARELLAEVDAAELAERKPAAMSGGQAARVALARALAVRPSLLLLDEPFAALDVDAAPRLRALLSKVLVGQRMSALLVTHDPLDALVLADRVAVLDGGRVVETGPAREVLSAPSTPFAARITGVNLVAGTVDGGGVLTATGDRVYGVAQQELPHGSPAVAVFGPTAVSVHPRPPEGSPRNVAPATVARIEPHGDLVRLRFGGAGWVDGTSADITPASLAELAIHPGQRVVIAVKAGEVAVHPKRAP
jgi:molybdate transport system ATP-binding protein